MVNWRKFFLPIPRGSIGDHFVKELARLLRLYADKSSLEGIAITAVMTFSSLMLMKLTTKSKPKEHRLCLKRRLELWEKGELKLLHEEAEALQRRQLGNVSLPKDESIPRRFKNLMRKGKVKDAKCLLDNNSAKPSKNSDVLNGKTVMEILQEKHPDRAPLHLSAISTAKQQSDKFHPILFEGIDSALIRSMALRIRGSAGPSGLDAHDWR